MSWCGGCEKNTQPVKDLQSDGRVKDLCGVCGSFLQPEPVTVISVSVDGKTSRVVGVSEVVRPPDVGDGMPRINVQGTVIPADGSVAVDHSIPLTTNAGPVDTSRPVVMLLSKPAPATTDIISQARARLVVIETELQRFAAMQREHRKLTAMVAAADAADAEDPDPAAAAEAAE